MTDESASFVDQCRDFLQSRWKIVAAAVESGEPLDPLLPAHVDLRNTIVACLTSPTKSYRYVLPTQVLCKCVDPSLDSHSLQAGYDQRGAFDARQKNKDDWDRLVVVLDRIEELSTPHFTQGVFEQILVEIYRLLRHVQVLYPAPNRVSLAQAVATIDRFSHVRSGGDRIEAVCTALFRVIATQFHLFDEVRREKVNVADTASGMGADIECSLGGKVILLVEVKDRALRLTQLDVKLDVARAQRISEILFLAQQDANSAEKAEIDKRIAAEFVSGQNIYVSSFLDFAKGILILLGEKGRVPLLCLVGEELDRAGSDIVHRRAWAQLLRSI